MNNNNESEEELDLEWEEWDGTVPFWNHCIAGSIAGVTEHTLLYPVDTVKTHLQCTSCPLNNNNNNKSAHSINSVKSNTTTMGGGAHHYGIRQPATTATTTTTSSTMISTVRHIMSHATIEDLAGTETKAKSNAAGNISSSSSLSVSGASRLWRGVQSVVIGCIPAHALYFSTYEITKGYFISNYSVNGGELSPLGGMVAGGVATIGHDVIMSPLDTIKQRLQLGHYNASLTYAINSMIKFEGISSLYRSFPITLLTNVPYGMIMVSTNEILKQKIMKMKMNNNNKHNKLDLSTCLISSSIAGMVASGVTTPLDRIKTLLQTQRLLPTYCIEYSDHINEISKTSKTTTSVTQCPKSTTSTIVAAASSAADTTCNKNKILLQPLTVNDAIKRIYINEGIIGFYRGIIPRILTHTPAVAISWTTYETAKQWLLKL